MTTLAPPVVGAPVTGARGGRTGAVAWMSLPALAVFLGFGVIPLIGVLALSFTSWDGIGAIHPAGTAIEDVITSKIAGSRAPEADLRLRRPRSVLTRSWNHRLSADPG